MLHSRNDEIIEIENKCRLLVVTRGREYEKRVCVYERIMWGVLMVMDMLCVLTLNTSILVVTLFWRLSGYHCWMKVGSDTQDLSIHVHINLSLSRSQKFFFKKNINLRDSEDDQRLITYRWWFPGGTRMGGVSKRKDHLWAVEGPSLDILATLFWLNLKLISK